MFCDLGEVTLLQGTKSIGFAKSFLALVRRGRSALFEGRDATPGGQRAERENDRSARETFSEVYKKNLWGGVPGELYSGPGSRYAPAELYAEAVVEFIRAHGISTVVDIGCGDFSVGKKIAPVCTKYIGVDVVPEVVERNTQLYGRDQIEFKCLDAIDDVLPDAQLCLIRQVLQHLSNKEISDILAKVKKYPYLIVTEHYPNKSSCFNKDIAHGVGTRVECGSAVFLDKPPFNATNLELLLETPPVAPNDNGEPQVRHDWGLLKTYRVVL